MHSDNDQKSIIGSSELIDIGKAKQVPAKIDTGADSSSVWASHIRVTKDGVLHFRLFDEGSPFYTSKAYKRKEYKVAVVRSASGHEQIRYRAYLPVVVGGRRIKALFNLSDRSRNNFPVLIGRRTIAYKFIVDVSHNNTNIHPKKNPKTSIIQKRLNENPHEFHKKYIKRLSGNADNIKLKKKGTKNEVSNSL
ncbi:ATP-dependent zinc protease [Candidatus Saccharibacteria bacterium]|nr:ATP-dependent zinc protease [Candidatus Saccharibacteria bacterium]